MIKHLPIPAKLQQFTGNDSREAQAERLRYIRDYTGLSRQELEKLLDIGHSTLKHWETGGQKIPLRRKQQLAITLKQMGFDCTVKWLEDGTSTTPQWSETRKLAAELDYFLSINNNSVGLVLENNTMQPQYSKGDAVGGIKIANTESESALEKFCIVELTDGHRMACRLLPAIATNCFNLEVLNSDISPQGKAVITDVKLNFIAPIVWHRSSFVAIRRFSEIEHN